MLVGLSVKNLALIEEAELNFTEGLNILSGETGAGKSIIIGSVNLALGERADKEVIRTGAEYALIELVFQENSLQIKEKMEEMELPWEEGCIIISRKILPGRSVFKMNGETVTARQIRQLSEFLLDIHGQHEHQSLLHKKKHLEILDSYAGEHFQGLLSGLKESFRKLSELKKDMADAALDEDSRKRELSLAEFELQEIEEARLRIGEDEELEETYRKMTHSRRIMESISAACRFTGGETEEGAAGQIGRALREIMLVADLDNGLAGLAAQLEEIDSLLHDFHRDMADYQEGLSFAETEFSEVEERLNRLNHLKAKYGRTIKDILAYQEKREQERQKLENYEAYRASLEKQLQEAEQAYEKLCEKASDIRKKTAAALEKQLGQALLDLNFMHVDFRVVVKSGEEWKSAKGYDDVEFMISTNPGEAVKPLSLIASGGELSRIMLGLKTVLADRDDVGTLIFDEIDSGISGKTAWKVSEKLGTLSKRHQVICITHLPQIAAMADTHFYIEKNVEKGMTRTTITLLPEAERIPELARMLGGDEISEAALENAKELIALAKKSI